MNVIYEDNSLDFFINLLVDINTYKSKYKIFPLFFLVIFIMILFGLM